MATHGHLGGLLAGVLAVLATGPLSAQTTVTVTPQGGAVIGPSGTMLPSAPALGGYGGPRQSPVAFGGPRPRPVRGRRGVFPTPGCLPPHFPPALPPGPPPFP